MSDDDINLFIAKLNNLIRKITINISNRNINGAIKDGELLKATWMDVLTRSGNNNIEIVIQKITEASLISFERIECILNDPTYYVFTNTIKQTDGEAYLLKFYNHIENERKFRSAIELFQSNVIQNKCLELMACTNGMQYETSINLMRKVLQLPNENVLNAFVNKLCEFDYPDISFNHLMEMFLIESHHQPEFKVTAELIRDAYITSMMERTERNDAGDGLIKFTQRLFDNDVSMALVRKCCQTFCGFYNLIKAVLTNYSKFIDQFETDDDDGGGDSIWYFKNEHLSANVKFNDFAKFIYNLATTESSFTNEFLLFLKNTFPSNLLRYIFAKFQ